MKAEAKKGLQDQTNRISRIQPMGRAEDVSWIMPGERMEGLVQAVPGEEREAMSQIKVTDQRESMDRIDEFISAQVTGRGLDQRTEKAYRQDLEHFYLWLEQNLKDKALAEENRGWEAKMESYLNYLSRDRGLRLSTITRKHKVLTYYLAYLVRQGIVPSCRSLKLSVQADPECRKTQERGPMSKQEVDALFQAVKAEYESLDSDFRRKVCLRDLVMLELLFYHSVEVSELLRLEASDYDRKSGILFLWGKHGKERKIYVFSKVVRDHMEQWLEERDYFEKDNEYHNRMFLSKLGRPLSMKMVINVVEKYRKLAGIEKAVTPKDLKNSMERYARELLMEQCG